MTDPQYSRRGLLRWSGAAGLGAAGLALLPPGTARADAPSDASSAASTGAAGQSAAGTNLATDFDPIRPPAVPLAVRSPYLSTWLPADNPAGTWPTFWRSEERRVGKECW